MFSAFTYPLPPIPTFSSYSAELAPGSSSRSSFINLRTQRLPLSSRVCQRTHSSAQGHCRNSVSQAAHFGHLSDPVASLRPLGSSHTINCHGLSFLGLAPHSSSAAVVHLAVQITVWWLFLKHSVHHAQKFSVAPHDLLGAASRASQVVPIPRSGITGHTALGVFPPKSRSG